MTLYKWSEIKASDLKQFTQKKPIFILGPREISAKRIIQLSKKIVTKKPIVWGCVTEKYIAGLENSPQFKTLSLKRLKEALKKLPKNTQKSIFILTYPQKKAVKILKQGNWSAVIGINGSWHRAFHYRDEYQTITEKKTLYKLVSSFTNKAEALNYFQKIKPTLPKVEAEAGKKYTDQKLIEFARQASLRSFDYTFQTGAVLAKDNKFLLATHNKVVPYETYMLHKGATKEKNLTGFQEPGHYDTSHAEQEMLIQIHEQGIDLDGCSLYINLMPCPACARLLSSTPLKEVVYQHEHSDGYAKELLEKAGKGVRSI